MGYRSLSGRLVIDEGEALWARQVFVWYLDGASALDIAARLNDAAVPLKTMQRPRPRPWNKPLVLRLLRNRLYVGDIACEGRFVPAEHTPLIERAMFEAVQQRLDPKSRRVPQSTRNPLYLVRGCLVCALCGAPMTSASTFRAGRLHRYYRCRTRDTQGKEACPTIQMPAEALEDFVVTRVLEALRGEEHRVAAVHLLEALGMQHPHADPEAFWQVLSPTNRQRLIRFLVAEVRVDQFQGSLRVTLRDPRQLLEEDAC